MIGETKTTFNTTFDKGKIKKIKQEALELNIKTNELIEIAFDYFNTFDKNKKIELVKKYKIKKYHK